MLVQDVSNMAESQLETANKGIIEGNYDRASTSLASAYRLALSVDNTELLCKVMLSGIVFKIACPAIDEIIVASSLEKTAPFLFWKNEDILLQAQKLAARSSEKELLSKLCVVYEVRILLENEKNEGISPISQANMQNYLSRLEGVRKAVSKEPYYLAYLYRTEGDMCLAGGNYAQAREHFLAAAKLHTKKRYLVEIGLDWYCVARACSLGGKKNEALSAILTALKYDKDAENTRGISSDYLAYSKILLKGSPSEEEKKLSAELESWSAKILSAGE